MRILAIESSCDETGAAIIEDGRIIRSNIVASQASVHARYGGVVPEVASRQQLSAFIPVVEMALEEANITWDGIDAIAATYGPGLAGSLLVGLSGAKALALARGLPFLGVNHLEAHIYANWLRPAGSPGAMPPSANSPNPLTSWPGDPEFPLVALVVSGAHTELVYIPHHGRYELLGQTRDDAAGEAFDKVARVLGLEYPGGPAIQSAAASAPDRPNPYTLPRAWLRGSRDFSFSGLKTAVLELVEGGRHSGPAHGASRYRRAGETLGAGAGVSVPQVAAAFQDAVVDVLATKLIQAASDIGVKQTLLAGGVAANLALRARLTEALAPLEISLRYPPVALCTDNAAMIGAAAYFHLALGERSGFDLDVAPGLQLPFAEPTAARS